MSELMNEKKYLNGNSWQIQSHYMDLSNRRKQNNYQYADNRSHIIQ